MAVDLDHHVARDLYHQKRYKQINSRSELLFAFAGTLLTAQLIDTTSEGQL
ncbi:MAG: hypothetical protein GY951_12845 [Psychromonas sp.]|nr:hypothetical protein [Psychromonas sp.]